MVGRSIAHYEIIEELGEGGMGVDGGPNWSRGGEWVYFASNRSGRYEVWRTKATGTIFSPLLARALSGGEERRVLGSASLVSFVVVEAGPAQGLTVSPDRETICVVLTHPLARISWEWIGRTISRCRILDKLGEGGMGAEPAQGFPHAGKWRRRCRAC